MLCLSSKGCKKSIIPKKKKLHMHFVDLEKPFDRMPRYVMECALKTKRMPEVLVRSVMSQHEGAKRRVRVDSELSEEFQVKVRMHQ